MKPKKQVVNFNYVDEKLAGAELEQLRKWYSYYHRLMKLHEWSYRGVRRKRAVLDFGSLGIAAIGVVAGAATMNVIVLAVVSGTGLLVNGSAKLLDLKRKETAYNNAYRVYSELLIRIKSYMRGTQFKTEVLVSNMALLDNIVAREAPIVKQKHSSRYDRTYSSLSVVSQ